MNSLVGASISWVIATFATLAFASLASRKKKQLSKSSLTRARILASITLIFIAVDIIRPFPILNISLSSAIRAEPENALVKALFESTKISSILLFAFAVLGILFALSGKKSLEEKAVSNHRDIAEGIDIETAETGLRSMTLLPIAVQLWVLIATNKLESFSEVLATGLFILSGPATWQFASQIMLYSQKSWDGFFQILKVMFWSLLGTFGAMIVGVALDMYHRPIDPEILSYLASFSLVIIPYFFFYSFWGDKWNEDKPIITIAALVVAGAVSAVNIGEDIQPQLVLSLSIWFILLIIPFCVRSNESFSSDYYCPKCASETKATEIRSFKGRLKCKTHPRIALLILQEMVEERKSLLRYLNELLRTRFWLVPKFDDVVLKLEPDKQIYRAGEQVTLTAEVRNNRETTRDHRVICNIKIYWKIGEENWQITEDHSWIYPDEPKRAVWPFEGPIPTPLLEPEMQTTQDISLNLEVSFSHYKPKGYRKRSIPFPRRITISISKLLDIT